MMDASGVAASIAQVDSMLDRCDHLISRNRPLTLDEPPRRKVVMPHAIVERRYHEPQDTTMPRSLGGGVSCGQLTGNEMRRPSGYSPRPQQHDDCDPDGMWATFEAEFDDMVAGMR